MHYREKTPLHLETPERVAALLDRFWSRTDKRGAGECWPWVGLKSWENYGIISHRKRNWVATRFIWTLTNGKIPDGHFICHRCDNPICVNLAHLYCGTPKQNTADSIRRGTQYFQRGILPPAVKGERHGHAKLKPQQVYLIRDLVECKALPQAEIARALGVAHSVVWSIASRKSWGHLA
jgi:hypothetical protein